MPKQLLRFLLAGVTFFTIGVYLQFGIGWALIVTGLIVIALGALILIAQGIAKAVLKGAMEGLDKLDRIIEKGTSMTSEEILKLEGAKQALRRRVKAVQDLN